MRCESDMDIKVGRVTCIIIALSYKILLRIYISLRIKRPMMSHTRCYKMNMIILTFDELMQFLDREFSQYSQLFKTCILKV